MNLAGNLGGEELFKTLLDNLRDGVYFVDRDRSIRYWNKSAERISGYDAGEVVGSSCHDNILVHVDADGNALCLGRCPLAAAMEDGQTRNAVVYMKHKEGHRVPVNVTVTAIRDAAGNIIGGLETFNDNTHAMSALQEMESLRAQALLDPLTGVGNRRYTGQVLEVKLLEARQHQNHLAVVFLDIDHFKLINDRYGHPAGDVVLRMVARTLANAMRVNDFLGRWGGEEFVAILPGVHLPALQQTAERLRALVESSSRDISKQRLSVTVSAGATLSKEGDNADNLLTRADEALYASKRAGRNRVTVA
jgi:diguanylate cyclase (GGDEF)-like protein/PAS domain S-box-containing protein